MGSGEFPRVLAIARENRSEQTSTSIQMKFANGSIELTLEVYLQSIQNSARSLYCDAVVLVSLIPGDL